MTRRHDSMNIRILKQYCQCEITHVDVEVHGGADRNIAGNFRLGDSGMEVHCGECGTAVGFEVEEWGRDMKCPICDDVCDIEITAKCGKPDPDHSHYEDVLGNYAGMSFFYGLRKKSRKKRQSN